MVFSVEFGPPETFQWQGGLVIRQGQPRADGDQLLILLAKICAGPLFPRRAGGFWVVLEHYQPRRCDPERIDLAPT